MRSAADPLPRLEEPGTGLCSPRGPFAQDSNQAQRPSRSWSAGRRVSSARGRRWLLLGGPAALGPPTALGQGLPGAVQRGGSRLPPWVLCLQLEGRPRGLPWALHCQRRGEMAFPLLMQPLLLFCGLVGCSCLTPRHWEVHSGSLSRAACGLGSEEACGWEPYLCHLAGGQRCHSCHVTLQTPLSPNSVRLHLSVDASLFFLEKNLEFYQF